MASLRGTVAISRGIHSCGTNWHLCHGVPQQLAAVPEWPNGEVCKTFDSLVRIQSAAHFLTYKCTFHLQKNKIFVYHRSVTVPYEDKYKFPGEIRQKIRKDADYRCQLCDTETHGEVHHILSVGFLKDFVKITPVPSSLISPTAPYCATTAI